jgi:hypothetical protein
LRLPLDFSEGFRVRLFEGELMEKRAFLEIFLELSEIFDLRRNRRPLPQDRFAFLRFRPEAFLRKNAFNFL